MPQPSDSVIIVAGGSGTRMQATVPKQFLLLANEPILIHTIRKFYSYNPSLEMVVVLPEKEIAFWQQLCVQHQFTISHKVVAGGNTRFQSVKNGLAAVTTTGVIGVHDGVRPLVPVSVIAEAYAVARQKGNAVVAVPLKDSIRKVTETGSQAEDRSLFRLVQTPQCFRTELLKQAYALPEETTFTDDASVAEKLGETIHLTEGSYQNLKITTPEDLFWAEALLQKPNA